MGLEDEDFSLSTYMLLASCGIWASCISQWTSFLVACFTNENVKAKKCDAEMEVDSSLWKYLIQYNAPRISLLVATDLLHTAKRVTNSSSVSLRLSFCCCMLYVPSFSIDMNTNKSKTPIPSAESRVIGINQSLWHHWLFCGDRSWYLFSSAFSCTLKTNSLIFNFLFLFRLKQNTSILTTNSSQDLGKISKVIKPTECVWFAVAAAL